ncbi:hypothetical protein [Streptomyces sp. NPDC001933]|uniref:hypothetical protein n=1 Tax=Streptomyces sp. NPDC001933 TaxID=3364626 RepID=UPI00367BE760
MQSWSGRARIRRTSCLRAATIDEVHQALRQLRKAASGQPVDVDAVHERLTEVGLCHSEDQDPERHIVSQSAYAAAAWLRLLAGRKLRTTADLEGDDQELVAVVRPIGVHTNRRPPGLDPVKPDVFSLGGRHRRS